MRSFQLSDIAAPLAGELHGRDEAFSGVSTDTRLLQPGHLFVALAGENYDANRFLALAANANASAAVVNQVDPDVDLPQLQVSDTLKALGQLAALNRDCFEGPLVGITGSCGKTTVKNMLARIFCCRGTTLATDGNFNNEVGVPLTLLRLSQEHELAVVEMGAAARGDIRYLCEFARPGIALINNAMPAHLEGFGSVEGVAIAKGEIYQALPEDGIAALNLDDPHAPLWREYIGARRLIGFSLKDTQADVLGSDIKAPAINRQRFTLHYGDATVLVNLRVPGQHNVLNALAAASLALAAGMTLKEIVSGLEAYEPVDGRLAAQQGVRDCWCIDDTYNANPGSVKAAIDVLAESTGHTTLILGDMGELGADSDALHREIGVYARDRGVDQLLGCGVAVGHAVDAFGENAVLFERQDELIQHCRSFLETGSLVLVKGSRSAAMEKVFVALTQPEGAM